MTAIEEKSIAVYSDSSRQCGSSWAGTLLPLLGTALLLAGCSTRQKTFASPEDAARALAAALHDDDNAELQLIFGRDGRTMISSGDDVADRNAREKFLAAYEDRNFLNVEPDGSRTLHVGPDDWPMPIPIVACRDAWRFDTARGRDELLNRRIGRNELSAMQICRAIVDAQQEYAAADRNGDGVAEFARKFISDPGTRNGLYWDSREDEPPSPLGALVADAAAEGYSTAGRSAETPQPYHGYCFKMLTAQGPHAPGGARDYLVNGKMTEGFAVVAWPAEYGVSGIMTFMVSRQGVIYERNLGRRTGRLARSMTVFDPDSQWSTEQWTQ